MEIERKFLVEGTPWSGAAEGTSIRQGYLSSTEQATVRVRVTGHQAWLTIKGPTQGISREEFEYEIPHAEGMQLLALSVGDVIEKVRYLIDHEGDRWEVDVFEGANQGLVVAELELEHEDQAFAHPPWLGAEVSDDFRYQNRSLSRLPYSRW